MWSFLISCQLSGLSYKDSSKDKDSSSSSKDTSADSVRSSSRLAGVKSDCIGFACVAAEGEDGVSGGQGKNEKVFKKGDEKKFIVFAGKDRTHRTVP